MNVEIKIIVEHKPEFTKFDKQELISDLNFRFVDVTGYKAKSIEITEL